MARSRWAAVSAPLAAFATGIVLVGGVVAWRLGASTFTNDVNTICYAETGSGVRLDRDMARVTQWVRGHLATSQGGEFFASLRDEPLRERAKNLRAQATALLAGPCPLAQSYDDLAADGDYRTELQSLCSRFTFPGIADLAPAARVQRLAEWLGTQAATPRARALGASLGLGLSAKRTVVLLRAASAEVDVLSCDLAAAIELQPPQICGLR